MQETGFSAAPSTLSSSVSDFAGVRSEYYTREFEKIQSSTRFPWSWNTMAAVAGPFWSAVRGMWGLFWAFLVLELLALVQIGNGLWGDDGMAPARRARWEGSEILPPTSKTAPSRSGQNPASCGGGTGRGGLLRTRVYGTTQQR